MADHKLNPRAPIFRPRANNSESGFNRAAMYVSPKDCNMSIFLTSWSTVLNDRNSPLLRLPGELRNRIYEYVIDECGYVFRDRDFPILASGERKNRVAILVVCRQVH
jgi:hypothetical protein